MFKTLRAGIIIIMFTGLQSCYTVKIESTHGTPNPNVMSVMDDDNRNFEVIEVDTIVKSSLFTEKSGLRTQRNRCKSGKLHTVEYKNTFGGSLLYLVTLGSRRKVKLKYICMKVEN
ncbi:hypothetical protein MHTCC0001_00420 [Flavobacteriaceae bacterium MHTCC 0001]